MVRKQRNLIGCKFGKLIVIESCGKGKDGHYYSMVECECGARYLTPDTELIYGRRSSCKKCSKPRMTHGKTNTKLFEVWQSMKQRCYDKNHQNYEDYGGRGIIVCDEWKSDFQAFYDWAMANGYADKLTIDRVDVNGNYEPSNCRWANKIVQANNKRNNHLIEYKGKTYTIAELSRKHNIGYSCLYMRIQEGWDIERALTLKPKLGRNQYEKR